MLSHPLCHPVYVCQLVSVCFRAQGSEGQNTPSPSPLPRAPMRNINGMENKKLMK